LLRIVKWRMRNEWHRHLKDLCSMMPLPFVLNVFCHSPACFSRTAVGIIRSRDPITASVSTGDHRHLFARIDCPRLYRRTYAIGRVMRNNLRTRRVCCFLSANCPRPIRLCSSARDLAFILNSGKNKYSFDFVTNLGALEHEGMQRLERDDGC
jgi:hypothetical protein